MAVMSVETKDTEHIQRLLVEQDPSALEYLFQYARLLEVILQRRFGEFLDEEDCRDIVADTLIYAWQSGERFSPQLSSMKSWLIMLVMYRAREHLRRNRTAHSVPLDAVALEAAMPEEAQVHGVQHPSGKFRRLLDRLPPRRALIIEMYYYEGRTVAEIARTLRISEAGVRSHLSHGRASLRQAFESERNAHDLADFVSMQI